MRDKLINLMRALAEQTADKELQWTEVVEDTYRTQVGSVIIRIDRGSVREEDEYGDIKTLTAYALSVTNPQGREVEDAKFIDGDVGFTAADTLFRAARSSAYNTEQLLDDVLSRLQKKKT